ncbi:hypothetical protein ASD65_03515 [Microbacterium sp. Root61]|uniref:ABC transporter substrate-binding protein n=1 Tax=Microbacterium sp. Root61 TaxID=1736570 RepID=UPI0006F1F1E4|nr:ABC transporter substrate-binding protein [Microbacterium sp. Root61]KRA23596.1 hypothetical protein ASD65_03515 [Microbacterium sp. Root61]
MTDLARLPHRRARHAVAIVAAVSLGLTLTACSAPAAQNTPSAVVESLIPVEDGAYPTTIEHAFGEAVITEEPKRIVTIGIGSEDTVIALGVVPVAVPDETWAGDEDGYLPWVREAVDEIGGALPETLTVSDTGEMDFEQILDLAPDLILAPYSGITETDYDRLASIATTVAYADEAWGTTSWQDQADIIGQALGRPAATEELIEAAEASLADAAAAHPEFEGKTFAYGMALAEGSTELAFYDSKDGRIALTEQLGLVVSPAVAAISANRPADVWYGAVSLEKLDEVDSDVFIAWGDDQAQVDASLANPLLAQWSPIASGSDIWITDRKLARATTSVSILNMDWVLENYVPLLAGAVAE